MRMRGERKMKVQKKFFVILFLSVIPEKAH